MALFIALQSTYKQIEIALYDDLHELSRRVLDKTIASKELVPTFNDLLTTHKKTLKDLSYIAVNAGPGPFTTLRVVIATTNGIAYATGLPLVGINGIQALQEEIAAHQPRDISTIALLNAFGKDVYFAYPHATKIVVGVGSIDAALETIATTYQKAPIVFTGNGAVLWKTKIESTFTTARFDSTETPSLGYIAKTAFKQWQSKTSVSAQLEPLYLKNLI